MGRTERLTLRIPAADSAGAAIAWVREQSRQDVFPVLTVDVADDGRLTAKGGPAAYLATPAHLIGRITEDGDGPLLTAEVHQVRTERIWFYLMAVPAVLLLLGTGAQALADGFYQPFLYIGAPGAAALFYLLWRMLHQQRKHFHTDVAGYDREMRELLGHEDG